MTDYKDFAKCLQKYFEDYLTKERGCGPNTMRSYSDVFVSFLQFMYDVEKIKPERLTMEKMNRELIMRYLDWLESAKQCSIQTRNQRLACLHSFFKYMSYLDPTHLEQWKEIGTIRKKQCTTGRLNYLTLEAVCRYLGVIDTTTLQGRKHLTMLSLLYNAGVRAQELADLTISSVRLSKPYTLTVIGKGNKQRVVPLDDHITELIKRYLRENQLDRQGKGQHPLFFNVWHGKLTTAGIAHIVRKYYEIAKAIHPNLFPDRISPHVFRHSRAMHLLQAGVNLIYIRDILGHVSIQTTQIYARADSDAKRVALEKAYASIGITEPQVKTWKPTSDLISLLKSYSH